MVIAPERLKPEIIPTAQPTPIPTPTPPLIPTAIRPTLMTIAIPKAGAERRRYKQMSRCPKCGYSQRSYFSICPKCGYRELG